MGFFSWHNKDNSDKEDIVDFESMYDGVDDYIADAIAFFAEANISPIPYSGNDSIYR